MTPSISHPGAAGSRWPFLFRNILIMVSVTVLATLSAYHSRLHYEKQARVSADNLSQVLGNHINSAIEKIDLVLKTVVRDVLQQQFRDAIDRHNLELLLAQQQLLLPDAKNLLIADRAGGFKYGTDVPPGFRIDISGMDYFIRLRDDPGAELVISGPYVSPIDKQWVMVFSRRMTLPDGSFAGIVAATISADHFGEMLSSLNVGAHGVVVLRSADLSAIARFPRAANAEVIGSKAVSREFRESLETNPDYGSFVARGSLDGIERTIAYRQIPALHWYVLIGLATQDYLAPWWDEIVQLLAIAGGFIAITFWLSRMVQRSARERQAISRLLQESVESVAMGFAIFDPDDRLVICNQAARDFFSGLPTGLASGAQFIDIIREAAAYGRFSEAAGDIEQWIQERIRRHQAAAGAQFELKLQDGRELLVVERRTPSRHAVINAIDITELSLHRRQLERLVETRTAELKTALDQFRILIELSPTALAMLDKDLHYLAASRRWIEDYGKGRAHLGGQHIYEVHPDFPEHWQAVHRAALAGVASSKDEDLWIMAGGSRHWLRWAVFPWIDASGAIGGIVISTEDITGRKLAEQALVDEREIHHRILEQRVAERTAELQAANRQLEGFLYAASHDLRGPLGRINSFSTLLERNYRERLEGEGIVFLDFIRENAIRLTKLIDDLLSHARVDQQMSQLQAIDLLDVMERTLEEMANDVRETGTAIRLELPRVRVLADAYGLKQVMYNLLENALKYSARSAPPTIEIGGEAMEGRFHLWVRDNGIGFAMEYRDKIFEIFRRLHTYAEYTGTGIGLALVKRAMERMGGEVWAESEPGQGATFHLVFQTPSG